MMCSPSLLLARGAALAVSLGSLACHAPGGAAEPASTTADPAALASEPVASATATAPADPIPAVKAAATEFDQAQLHADRAAIDRYLASDFVFVRGAGVVAD